MPYTRFMKALYIEKNPQKTTVFEQGKAGFQFIKEFPTCEQKKFHEWTKQVAPAQFFIANQEDTFNFWLKINTSHNPLDWIEKNIQENSITFDYRLELLCSALSHPKISERNFQEGITLIIEKNFHFFAVLLYKNYCYGAFEHNLTNLSPELFKKDLEEFRFGWLPNEEVIKQKGCGCILKNIPAEAEGFHPTFIICEHQEYFADTGRFITLENTKENMCKLFQ